MEEEWKKLEITLDLVQNSSSSSSSCSCLSLPLLSLSRSRLIVGWVLLFVKIKNNRRHVNCLLDSYQR
jgi:hypothetical protein